MRAVWPEGPDYVLDLVGTSTAADSLRLVRRGGTVCMAGTLSGWLIPDFEPIAMIPSGTRLTAFHSDNIKGSAGTTVLQRVVRQVEAGVYRPNLDRSSAWTTSLPPTATWRTTKPPGSSSCCRSRQSRGQERKRAARRRIQAALPLPRVPASNRAGQGVCVRVRTTRCCRTRG